MAVKRKKPPTKSLVQQLSDQELAALCPEVFGSVNAEVVEIMQPVGFMPKPVYRTVKGLGGALMDVVIAWEGEGFMGFMRRTGLDYPRAMEVMNQAAVHPKNDPLIVGSILAEGFKEAVRDKA